MTLVGMILKNHTAIQEPRHASGYESRAQEHPKMSKLLEPEPFENDSTPTRAGQTIWRKVNAYHEIPLMEQ